LITLTTVELEKNYGNKCSSKKSNISNYNSCLLEQEARAVLEEKNGILKDMMIPA
jgi:hypothetical protein